VFISSTEFGEHTITVLKTGDRHRYYLSNDMLPLNLVKGALVTVFRNWISYIDPVTLEQLSLQIPIISRKNLLHLILEIPD